MGRSGEGARVEIEEEEAVALQMRQKVRIVFGVLIQIIGVESVLREIVYVLGAGHLDTLRKHATAKPMVRLEVENLGVEGVVVVLVEVEEEEDVEDKPGIVRVRMRRMKERSRGMRRC